MFSFIFDASSFIFRLLVGASGSSVLFLMSLCHPAQRVCMASPLSFKCILCRSLFMTLVDTMAWDGVPVHRMEHCFLSGFLFTEWSTVFCLHSCSQNGALFFVCLFADTPHNISLIADLVFPL